MRYILANWKMHLSAVQSVKMIDRYDKSIKSYRGVDIVVFPSFTCIARLKGQILSKGIEKKFKLGVQNIYYEEEGAFTGEVSAFQAKEFADYAIVGHSERRINFGENDNMISKKIRSALRHNLIPVLCVGENATQHSEKIAKRVVLDQLSEDLSYVSKDEISKIIIAYEPVWAIGTGDFADPREVGQMIGEIRFFISELLGERAKETKVLYGGSVEPDNASSYLKITGCDGLLVGGASLNYQKFAEIVECATNLDL
jgi:triosephosphate isomerase